jgi:hypothetical protein
MVFNILGQETAQLANGEAEAGYHDVKFEGNELSSGVCRLSLCADCARFVKFDALHGIRYPLNRWSLEEAQVLFVH